MLNNNNNIVTPTLNQVVFSMPFGLGLLGGNPQPTTPFLPSMSTKLVNNKSINYSLVLDLDETLVHFFYTPSGGTFLIRPYAHEFLRELSSMYEIIIFTAAMKEVF